MCPRQWPGDRCRPRWPDLLAAPYADVACDVVSRFMADGIADLARMTREGPMTCSAHPAGKRRWCSLPRIRSCWSCFSTGPRSPSRIWRCSLLARLMDHALAMRKRAHHDRGWRSSGDTGGAAVDCVRRPGAGGPRGNCSPTAESPIVQRRMITTSDRDNVSRPSPSKATFDDCQALVKSDVQSSGIPRIGSGSRAWNSINFARIAAQVVYYFVAAVALGAPHRKVAFTVADRKLSATPSPATWRPAWACRSRGLTIATNVKRHPGAALLATGTYEPRERDADPRHPAMGHSNFVELRAADVRRLWARPAAGSWRHGRAVAQIAPLPDRRARLLTQNGGRFFSADRALEDETAAAIRTTRRGDRLI